MLIMTALTSSPLRAQGQVNSLVATFSADGASAAVTRSQLQSILPSDATSDDKLMALGSIALGSRLDALLIANDKFEKVPQYRVSHVVQTLIEGARLSESETASDIYARLVSQWRAACKPRLAAGRGCDFAFRFEKNDWVVGVPDFSRRLSAKHLSHLSSETIYAMYRPIIHDLAKAALERGKASYTANGKTLFITREAADTEATLLEKAKKLMLKVEVMRNYLVIDNDYIVDLYKHDIQRVMDEVSKEAFSGSVVVKVASSSSVLEIKKSQMNASQIRELVVTAFRKLHSQIYFNTQELVVFPRREIPSAIRQNEWDGFAFRLSHAPEKYEDFVKAVTEHLDTLYLKVTRQKMLSLLLGQKSRRSDIYVAPIEVEEYVAKQPAFRRSGKFTLISIPLNVGYADEDLKKISTQIVDTFSTRGDESADHVLDRLAEEVRNTYGVELLRESIDFESRYSALLPAPSRSRDLQMHQILFAEKEAEAMGAEVPQLPDLIYFVDRERSLVSFLHTQELGAYVSIRLDASKEEDVDRASVEDQLMSMRFAELYKKTILKVIEDSLLRIRDSQFVYGQERDPYSYSATDEIKAAVLKAVESLESAAPGSGWSRFFEAAVRSPLKPKDLRLSELKDKKKRRP